MKTKYHILFFLIATLLIAGCAEEEVKSPQGDDFSLIVTHESVILNEAKPDEQVLAFSWNQAASMGAEYTTTYLFQLDAVGNDFATATDPVTLTENASISFTNLELYNLIVEKWGKTAGQQVQLEARIVAKVTGPKFQYPKIAYNKVLVTTYVPEPQSLYLMGTATDAGLDATKAIKMEELSNGRLYNWKGTLKPGSFKFISTLGLILPSYNKGADNNSIVKRVTEAQSDDCFDVTQAGTYYIYLSKINMSISYKKVLWEKMYIVGDATSAGWELNKLVMMTPDNLNPNIFIYQGGLKEGSFKIITEPEWQVPTFRPKVADGSIESDEVQLTGGEPDYKWKVTAKQAGIYKIILDTENITIKFQKM